MRFIFFREHDSFHDRSTTTGRDIDTDSETDFELVLIGREWLLKKLSRRRGYRIRVRFGQRHGRTHPMPNASEIA